MGPASPANLQPAWFDNLGGQHTGAVRGDWVEIVVEAGGEARTYEISATRAGRRVEVSVVRNVVTVAEVTRGGGVVRTGRFMANRVLALVEHPAAQSALANEMSMPPDGRTSTTSGPAASTR